MNKNVPMLCSFLVFKFFLGLPLFILCKGAHSKGDKNEDESENQKYKGNLIILKISLFSVNCTYFRVFY